MSEPMELYKTPYATDHEDLPGNSEETQLFAARVILKELLSNNDGCVSTKALKKALQDQGFSNPNDVVASLKYPAEDEGGTDFRHHGRSFFDVDTYEKEMERRHTQAIDTDADTESEPAVDNFASDTKRNRQEEGRLCSYIRIALDDLYGTEFGPDVDYAFDVHDKRSGSTYQNVDLLCIHWRSDLIAEIIAVEAKLSFNAVAVQQAMNYARFSDRVWVAVPVSAQPSEAASELREADPLLFDYVVENGLGILACKRTQGRGYNVYPIHWPLKKTPDPLSRKDAINRYRGTFEEARVIPPDAEPPYPAIGS